MLRLPLTVCALLSTLSAFGQVAVREYATKARLVDGKTTISLAVTNYALKPLETIVLLEWLGPDNNRHDFARNATSVPPGESNIDIALPLSDKFDALLERLHYQVVPGSHNYTSFLPVEGMLSVPHIADYAFALHVLSAATPRPGKPFEVRVLTSQAVTGMPVTGVQVRSSKSVATSDRNGVAVLRIPTSAEDDTEDFTFQIEAQLGDFHQKSAKIDLECAEDDLRIYTDKPLYQPGQTMHVRILSLSAAGPARASVEHQIRVTDKDDNVVHAATVETSRFGVASTDWEIPSKAASGDYVIEVERDTLREPVSRTVKVTRYELPSFRVGAKPDRPFYLVGEQPSVEIRGEYLFGKPVGPGTVRITEGDEDDIPVAEGPVDGNGIFHASIPATTAVDANEKYFDRHFNAFLTDASTNRTEQRKFDIRISRDPLHIYIAKQEHVPGGLRLYLSVDSPDGNPAVTNVEVLAGSSVLASGKTNRFGIARILIPDRDYDELAVLAITPNGTSVRETLNPDRAVPNLWLDTNHSLYRLGEPIRCHIASTRNTPALLWVWDQAGETLYSQSVVLSNGAADVTISYNPRFRRDIAIGIAQGASNTAARTVVFPGQDALEVRATPSKPEYKPGETATIAFHASSEAALGIAVVDESVLERAAADSVKRRTWFEFAPQSTASLGGLTEHDLLNLDPANIDDSLQLVAAALLGPPAFNDSETDLRVRQWQSFDALILKTLAPVKERLEANYQQTLSYPRDSAGFFAAIGNISTSFKDPWLQAYEPRFTTEGTDDVIRIMSSGPDKRLDTDDDFCALEIRFKWFAKVEALIHEILHKSARSSATPEEFTRELEAGGIRFDAFRDPWGNAMHITVANLGPIRRFNILSDGPDRKSGTRDDFVIADFSFRYFWAMSNKMQVAIASAPEMPRTTDELRGVLQHSGIDFDSLRDPWGHAYYADFRIDNTYADDVRLYTYSEYNGTPEQRKQITPVLRKTIVIEIRSVGEDGVAGTYDDFPVAMFRRIVDEKSGTVSVETTSTSTAPIAGTGTLEGVVTDQAGAVVPNVTVTLNDVYVTRTGEDGVYRYRAIKPATYKLHFESPGFQFKVIDDVPVKADHVTRADATLTVGSVSETVDVAATPQQLNTETAEISARVAPALISTPRVREYFPETLYWQPELVTDRTGEASIRVKLADSITTWHVAVIASTLDGRITETSTAIRAFQPFMADLDVPQVLTAGDEIALPVPIRNYLDREQTVKVSTVVPHQIALREAVRQPGQIPASSSADSVLHLRAELPGNNVRLRVTAIANADSDAIEKPVSIHPDGQRRELTLNAIIRHGQSLQFELPSNATAGSIHAEVKFYPSLVARILESIEAVLEKPYGCGEQTISSTYPNVLFLRALEQAHLKNAKLEAKAMKNLGDGYRRLLNYQDDGGGFTYWGHGHPDVALTAYALRFFHDAKEFIDVDADRVAQAQHWLAGQPSSGLAIDALQLEALAQLRADGIERRLGDLARKASELDDPYAIANFAIAAMETGNKDAAKNAVNRLCRMAEDEKHAAYWSIRANTPFHAWGRWGQVETTGVVVSALAKWRNLNGADATLDALIDRGVLFLIQNADSSGSWATSQATARSLDALISVWAGMNEQPAAVRVLVNGVSAGAVSIPAGNVVHGPAAIDITRFVRSGAPNEISFIGAPAHAIQLQMNAAWYETWDQPILAKTLEFKTDCGPTRAAVNHPVTCDVFVSRPAFRGYGMLIAEIGLPPGAEVDRGTLQNLIDETENGIDSFEVAPDHVTFYIWPQAVSRFQFVFRPRFVMKARTAQSVLYDYYNPDERSVLPPRTFTIE